MGKTGAIGLLALVLATACMRGPAAPAAAPPVPPIRGRVLFPVAPYQIRATISEVATAATVSLIDPVSNETKATTLTDDRGQFSFDLGIMQVAADPLYVEAVKGLGSNAIGRDAVRVRTLVQFKAGGWTSLSGGTPGGPVVISPSTTAVTVVASLRQSADPVDPARLIGSLAIGQPSGNLPDTFLGAGTGIAEAEFATVRGHLVQALLADHDPFDAIWYSGGNYLLKPGIAAVSGPAITFLRPRSAGEGAEIAIYGSGFGERAADVRVTFQPGLPGAVSLPSPTEIRVTVPRGARSGDLEVNVGGRSATASFTVLPGVDGAVNL